MIRFTSALSNLRPFLRRRFRAEAGLKALLDPRPHSELHEALSKYLKTTRHT